MATARSTVLILILVIVAVTTSIIPPVAESSIKQRRLAPKRHAPQRMIYGFTFSNEELVEWAQQHFGYDKEHFLRRAMSPLYQRCHSLWYRTTQHMVTYYRGPRRGSEDWCLTLADNISPDTATPPPRQIIDKIKQALDITRDPEWHVFLGD